MNQELIFANCLNTAMDLAKASNYRLTSEQVREIFEELKLDENQLTLVYDYLKKHQVEIDGEILDDDLELSEEEFDFLKQYEEEIAQIPPMSSGEREALAMQVMAGETGAAKKLTECYLADVVQISKLYKGQGVLMMDLIGEGNLALSMGMEMLSALEHANEAEGMLMKLVMDAMENAIKDNLMEDETSKKVIKKAEREAAKNEVKEQ